MSEPVGYFSQPPYDEPRKSGSILKMIGLLLVVFTCAGIALIVVLALLGPIIGNIFSSSMPDVTTGTTIPSLNLANGIRLLVG